MPAIVRRFPCKLVFTAVALFLVTTLSWAQADTPASTSEVKLLEPKPILPGDKVVTLFPPGHPALKNLSGYDQPEKFNWSKGNNPHVQNITNIHNPSIELQLPPADKANGTAVIVAAGGGNTTLWVGPEGAEIGKWLNGLGVAAFNERYRLKPYDSAVDALADTQRSVRMVRAHAKEWGVDPKKIGIMGFSAGGEQAAQGGVELRRRQARRRRSGRSRKLPSRFRRVGLCRLVACGLEPRASERTARVLRLCRRG